MADNPQDLLNDADFQKLSPEAQHIVIGKRFPEYAKLSPEAQKVVLSKAAPANADPNAGRIVMPVAGGVGIPMDLGSSDAADEFKRQNVALGPMAAGSLTGGLSEGLPVLARAAISGVAAGGVAAGTGSEHPVTEGVTQGVAPELGGAAIGKAGEFLSDTASKALARLLRLSPKAFQFGREPARAVLEEGISGMSLPKLVENIGAASKETTAQLKTTLGAAKGTVNAENISLDVANSLPGAAGNRFLKVIDDAAAKLGLRSNQLSNLSPLQLNELKQEVARQGKFIEGDMRASVGSAIKQFGGRAKDEMVKLAPDAGPLLEQSANLTEASKGGDYAIRMDKAGRGKGPLADVEANKPSTYLRPVTDSTLGAKTLFKVAHALKDSTGAANALRMAFQLVYPGANDDPTL